MPTAEQVADADLKLSDLALIVLADPFDKEGRIMQYKNTHGTDLDAFFRAFMPNHGLTVSDYIIGIRMACYEIDILPALDGNQTLIDARHAARAVIRLLGQALLHNDNSLLTVEATREYIDAQHTAMELNDEIESRSSTPFDTEQSTHTNAD